jgi:hypothetical protein
MNPQARGMKGYDGYESYDGYEFRHISRAYPKKIQHTYPLLILTSMYTHVYPVLYLLCYPRHYPFKESYLISCIHHVTPVSRYPNLSTETVLYPWISTISPSYQLSRNELRIAI